MRAGLIPALQNGYLLGAGARWRIAWLRPGEDPIGRLAAALCKPTALGGHHPDRAGTSPILMEATLRQSALGVADAVRLARLPRDESLLVLVDQFEELFRLRRNQRTQVERGVGIRNSEAGIVKPIGGKRGEAAPASSERDASTLGETQARRERGQGTLKLGVDLSLSKIQQGRGSTSREDETATSYDEPGVFVERLLQATRQHDMPVYVVLTMKSAFVGECTDFSGLPEAVNAGLYLVGRMSRDAWHSAITGPVALVGGTIAPRLVERLLDDRVGDSDELPLMQHALMRTWEQWEQTRTGDRPMDVTDYEAVGTFRGALSKQLEEVYEETGDEGRPIAEWIFKALTDTVSDARGVGRPTSVQALAAICGSSEAAIVSVVEMFRRPGRRFLTPPSPTALTGRTVIGLTHESLMRCWERIRGWAEEERESADMYKRLSQAAARFDQGAAGLLSGPDLEVAQQWKRENRPTAAWARRYDTAFDRAMSFLDRSLEERDRHDAGRERKRRWTLRGAQWAAAVLGVLLAAAVSFGYLIRREASRTEADFALARAALDQSLASVDRDPATTDVDGPQVQQLRRELLETAERFYTASVTRESASETSRRNVGFAHLRLGHVNRMRERFDEAEREYQGAVARFKTLATADPANAEDRAALANAYTWLGETLGHKPARHLDAELAYDNALKLQQVLLQESPQNTQYQSELARVHGNRGILRSSTAGLAPAANLDFHEAIRLLEPLTGSNDRSARELARAYNNLGALLSLDPERSGEVVTLWEKAISIYERLVIKDPGDRHTKLALAILCNNLAALLNDRGRAAEANRRSRMALGLIESLSRATPSLAIARAGAHNLRGMILQADDPSEAAAEYEEALDLFEQLQTDHDLHRLPEFHLRLGDLLLNLATFPKITRDVANARRLLTEAVKLYASVAAGLVSSGSRADAQTALDNLSRVLPSLPEPERAELTEFYQQLQRRLAGDGARR